VVRLVPAVVVAAGLGAIVLFVWLSFSDRGLPSLPDAVDGIVGGDVAADVTPYHGEFYAFHIAERGDLVPRREADLRDVVSVLPAIPHIVELDGSVPGCRRVISYRYSTNALMYRGTREYTAARDDDVYRIIVQGTGVSFGNGVDDDEVYSHLLEQHLADHRGPDGERFEVYNMAVPGSPTDIGVDLTERIVRELQFDFLVFCYGVNDGLPMFNRSVQEYSHTLQRLVEIQKNNGVEMLYLVEPRSSFYPWPYAEYRARFDEIVGGGHPDRPVIDLPALFDEIEMQDGLRLERERGRQQVVRYTDGELEVVYEVAYEEVPGRQSVSPDVYEFLDTHIVDQATMIDGVHPNERGHAETARILFDFFVEQGIATPAEPGADAQGD